MDLAFDKSTGFNCIVASDIHLFSVGHAEMKSWHELLLIKDGNEVPMFLTGDIVDRTNCKKKEVGRASNVILKLKEEFKQRYVFGNHEAIPIGTGYHIEVINDQRVLFLHGPGIRLNGRYHEVYYPEKKTIKWEDKKHGRGKWSAFKYKWFRKLWKHKGGWKKPSNKIINRVLDIADLLGCTVVVFGHTHREYDGTHDGVRIINVPKGVSYINI